LNSNLHSAVPDNLIQVILRGIASPVSSDLGYMPGFKDSLSTDQAPVGRPGAKSVLIESEPTL
jgi:hypothetical protein